MKRIVYGDIHGQFGLIPLMRDRHLDADEIIICGDVGIGFNARREDELLSYLEGVEGVAPKLRFIRGNHDNLTTIMDYFGDTDTFIKDGTVVDGVLFVGGAWSIDKAYRTIGFDWWEDEELTPAQWEELFRNIDRESVHTIISHDGPNNVTELLVNRLYPTVTGHHLTILRDMLPNLKRWVFGHYHVHFDRVVEGIHYTCLPDNGKTHIEL